MRSLVLIVAATALSARFLSASVASPTGWRSARITKARHRFNCGGAASALRSKMKTRQHPLKTFYAYFYAAETM